MTTTHEENKEEQTVEEVKAKIENLLKLYRTKKDDLEWANDDWESSEIQEELDAYAREIKVLKVKAREFEQA